MKTLKRNLLPIACCLLFAIDQIGKPISPLGWIALILSAALLFLVGLNVASEIKGRK